MLWIALFLIGAIFSIISITTERPRLKNITYWVAIGVYISSIISNILFS